MLHIHLGSIYLKQGDIILGTLYPNQNGDFPWIHCNFTPTKHFSSPKPLFDEIWKLTDEDHYDDPDSCERAEELYLKVEELYHLEDENGQKLDAMIGQVFDDFASFR